MTAGVLAVMVDPRTTFKQCLEAALVAELADNAAWEMLTELAIQSDQKDLGKLFEAAQEEEVVHLEDVRNWLAAAQSA
jgi:hypothetical protein